MRGISAKTLTDVLAAVEASTTGATVGQELFGVVSALDGAPALRRVLSDPSTEGPARAGLAADVFGGKVSDQTVGVVKTAVAGRWSTGRDLVDGLEIAGVAALVAAADAAGELDAVETELFELGQAVDAEHELRSVISDRAVRHAGKASLLTSLFGSKVSSTTLALAVQAAATRTGSFDRVLETFGEQAAARRRRLLAEVRSAYPLDAGEQQRLAAALASKYGHDVHLNLVVDPSVIGGLSVSIGDDVVDGTMSSRLETARRQLAG